jgi:transporter family protein
MQAWLTLAIVALAFWGITGVTQKLSTNNISTRLDWRLSPSLVALAALGGLLNGLGALTSFAALERGGKASVVIPLVSLYPLVTIGGAWLLLGERISRVQTAGVACAVAAVVLLSREPAPKERKR